MIIEINYLTVVIIGALLSAFAAGLWAVGRTFLQQYGSMLTVQLQSFQASEAKTVAQLASATNSSPETVFFVMEHLVTKGVQRVGSRQPDKVSYKK